MHVEPALLVCHVFFVTLLNKFNSIQLQRTATYNISVMNGCDKIVRSLGEQERKTYLYYYHNKVLWNEYMLSF